VTTSEQMITWPEGPMSGIAWSNPYQVVPQGRRKAVDVRMAAGDGVPDRRFQLYQTPEMRRKLPTMWMLHDAETGVVHYLFGTGWEGAQESAAERIHKILAGNGG